MTIHGTVDHWKLVVVQDGGTQEHKFHNWDAASDAFREARSQNPISASVYAVQQRSGREIITWDFRR